MPFPTALQSRFLVYTNPAAENEPTVAAGKDGRFSIEWGAVTGAEKDIYSYLYEGRTFGTSGIGAILSPGAYSDDVEDNPDTAFLNNGAHVLAYEKVVGGNRDIYTRIDTKDANGTYTTGTEFLVNSGATTGSQVRPEITALTGGGFVVGWEDNNDTTIKLQRYDAAGVAQGSVLSVGVTSSQANATVSFDLIGMANGGFAITHRTLVPDTFSSTRLSAWDASGTSVVSNLSVSAQATAWSHGTVSLTQLPNGNIGAFWYDSDNAGVGYRIFNSSFAPQTGDLLISATGLTGANGDIPRVAATLDNRFMVVFTGGTASTFGVYAQMVTNSGTLDGVATLISGTTNTSGQPEIERTADGRMVVTWQEAGDIYAAIYETRTTGLNLTGTTGDDNYVGSTFIDSVNGGAGDDAIFGSGGNDVLSGGDGDDTLEGGSSGDTLNGGNGDDQLFAYEAADPAGSSVGDVMLGEAGNDTLTGSKGTDNMSGGADNDSLIGNLGNDTLAGDGGNDTLEGGDDNDYLYGGAGDNLLDGGIGIDVMLGDSGNDTMNGGDAGDYFYAGGGINMLNGNAGDDVFISEGSFDIMDGGADHNFFYRYGTGISYVQGGTGIDEFIGGNAASNDFFYGNGGTDYGYGGDGNDVLEGGDGGDVLIGQNGNDTIDGGAGVNLIWCNDVGNDQVRVNVGDGGTQVIDFFEAGGANDSVRIIGSTLTSFTDFQALVTNYNTVINGNLVVNTATTGILYLNLGANQTAIWFQGIAVQSLTAADFTFG
jgi:Ca2+-binding RTX toxin-like protein